MRIVLLILMLTLLPLRGWMGDAMATSMAFAELRASSNSASISIGDADRASKSQAKHVVQVQRPSDYVVLAGTDCEGHTLSGQATSEEAVHCTPCSACGACHSTSISSAGPVWVSAVHGGDLLAMPADAFFSADAASSQKPPIS